MKVKALTRDVFLGWIERVGVLIPQNETKEIADAESQRKEFKALLDQGVIQVVSYGQSGYDTVSRLEFESFSQSIYKATLTVNAGTVTNPFTQAEKLSVNEGPFDLRHKNVLKVQVDNNNNTSYIIETVITPGIYTTTALAAFLNANADYTKHLVAAKDSSTEKLKQTSRSYGTTAKVAVLVVPANDANDIIGCTSAVVSGTGTPVTMEALVKDSSGNPLQNAKVALSVYDAASAGSLVATAKFQTMTKGTFSSLYDNTIFGYTDEEGKVALAVINIGASPATVYIELGKGSSDYFLASVPAARTAVSVV